MSFVLDASATLAWCFQDEATSATWGLLERLEDETAFVPAIWSLEIGNILISAERRKRITYAQISEFLELLGGLNIKVDDETVSRSFREILSLAHAEELTTYDAAYLELAMRSGLSLATKDNQLIKVAKKNGVVVIKL